MKEKCDNKCETCPMNGQIYCAVMFSRSTNQALPGIIERLENMEMELADMRKPKDNPPVINPLSYGNESVRVLEEED